MTIAEALADVARQLRAAGVEPARREARLLVGMALEAAPELLVAYPERPVESDARQRLADLVTRRCAGEPSSRLAGFREFWSLRFATTADTLDPRPDSETVVEAVLATVADRKQPLRVLDLGVGSGCLLLALLTELPNAFGVGVDISQGACSAARANAAALGLAGRSVFVVGEWSTACTGHFDIVVSNPPYIAEAEIDDLAPEVVRYDPRLALAGGADGLDAYRTLVPALPSLLAPGAIVALEVGSGQADAVKCIVRAAGLRVSSVANDLAGIARCIVAENHPESSALDEKRVSNEALSD